MHVNAQQTCLYLRDSSGQKTIEDILYNENFTQETDGDFGLDNVWHWLKIEVPLSSEKRILLIENSFLDEVHAYFQGPDTLIDFGEMSYATALEKRPVEHYQFAFPVALSGGQFYIRVYRKFLKINAPFQIYTEKEFSKEVTRKTKIYAGFTGIFICLIFFSLILFGINKEAHFLFYGLYTLFILLSTLLAEGSIVAYFHQYDMLFSSYNWRNVLNNFVVLWLFGFVYTFILKGAEKTPFLKTLLVLTLIGILVPLLILPFEPYYLDRLNDLPYVIKFYPYSGFIVGTFFCLLLVLYSLIFGVQPYSAKIFLIGFTPMVIYSFLSPLRNVGTIPDYDWLSYKTRLACILFDVVFIFIGAALQIRRISQEKHRQTRLALEAELQLYREKERISRDLHDNVGSQLTVISTGLDRAQYLIDKLSLKKENLEQLGEHVRMAIQSLRDSIWATHSEQITGEDLSMRIKKYISQLLEKPQMSGSLSNRPLEAAVALEIYRIFQEAAQNIAKHAPGSEVALHFQESDKTLKISLSDNGNGFDQRKVSTDNHFGLSNMKARAKDIGADLRISSESGKGTVIRLSYRLQE